ncbi:MAG: hypothetical protein DMF81_05180 [Acidobacteria bacterium]|nr:MAG: hypothetical protein DMF81_05180 [Acidobacteriota bacterium]
MRTATASTCRASSSVNSVRPKRNVAGARVVPCSVGPLASMRWRSGRVIPSLAIVARASEKSRRSWSGGSRYHRVMLSRPRSSRWLT